ncbi:hypothetical protein LXL04_000698 [Taraxacum kok-saghyz]
MYQETGSKYSNLKKRAKSASGKPINSSREKTKTLGFKEKGFRGDDWRGQSRRPKTDSGASNVGDERYTRKNDSGRNGSTKSKNDDFHGHRSKRAERDRGSFHDDKSHNTDSRGRGMKSNYRGRTEGEGQTGRDYDRNKKRVYANNTTNGEAKFQKAPGAFLSKNRTFNKRESLDERKNGEHGENRNGFMRKNREEKYETSKQLHSKQTDVTEDHNFGKKNHQNKKNMTDDSVLMFDRPKRKRRLIRIEYPNDPANKRFDNTQPSIDIIKTTEQKEDLETEENAEMSKNAQFRAIQPTPCIITFVNENLLGRRREIEFKKAGYNLELPSPLDNNPFSTSPERERIEESVFRNKLAFFAAAKVSSSFPSPDLPEIAFAGRSNVGKSSLLNSLTRQWGVVRTSDKPGLTQTINFFNLGSKLCLVDLPGYGFAYAKDEVKESWEELVKEYVTTREGLKRVCLLIDTKWGMKARDHELVELMERSKTKYQIVLTKTDLAFPVDVARRAMQIEESLKTKKSAIQPLMMVSSKTGAGIRSLRTVLSNISRFARL